MQLDERPVPLDPFELRPPFLVPDRLALFVAGRAPLPEVHVQDGRALLSLADMPAGLLDLTLASLAAPVRVGVAAFEPVQGEVQRVPPAESRPLAKLCGRMRSPGFQVLASASN